MLKVKCGDGREQAGLNLLYTIRQAGWAAMNRLGAGASLRGG
jgi:hypothetical protein